MAESVKCLKCGGRLVYEEFESRGRVFSVLPDGTIGKKFKYMIYPGDGDGNMVYCKQCGKTYDYYLSDHLSKVVLEGGTD